MTRALHDAFAAASRLPADEQDALAAAILEELDVDAKWHAALAARPAALESLADDALAEHRRGETQPLDPDKL